MLKYISYFLLIIFISSCKTTEKINSEKNPASTLTESQEITFGRMYLDATKEKILGNYEKSVEYYKSALTINPYSAAANYELGNVLTFLNEKELAFLQYKIAAKLEPSNFWYQISYAQSLKAGAKYNEAVEVYKNLVENHPTRIELKYELAELLMNIGQKEESIKYLNIIEDEIGVNEDLTTWKQRAYLSDNNIDAAIQEIEKLIEAFPEEIRYYGMLADVYASNDKNDKALEIYKKMEQIDPNSYRVQFALAEFYRREGKQELYLNNISRAFSNPEMNIDDKIKYVLTFYQVANKDTEKKKEGIDLVNVITKAHPDNAKGFALLGDFLYFDKQADEAKQAYIKTIELDSSRFPVWNQLLVILSETNDSKTLLNYAGRAVELFPNQPTVYLLYGLGLSQAKQHKKAIEYLKLGEDLVIDNQSLKSQIYSSIADSYYELKDYNNSDLFFEKSLALDPNNVYVLNNYSYYLSLRKEKLEKAKEMSAKSNNLAPNQSSFLDTYAWILFQLKDYNEALNWINKAIDADLNPSGVLLEHKGDILYQLNKVAEAVEYWKKAKMKGNAGKLIDTKISNQQYYE